MRHKSSTGVHLSNTDYILKTNAISYKFAKNRQEADKHATSLVHKFQKFLFFRKFLHSVIRQYKKKLYTHGQSTQFCYLKVNTPIHQ